MNYKNRVFLYEFVYGNQLFLYNNSNKDYIKGGITYKSDYISHTNIVHSLDFKKNNIKIILNIRNDIVKLFLNQELNSRLRVKIIETFDGVEDYLFSGDITDLTIKGFEAELTAQILASRLSRVANRFTYQSSCNHQLFDKMCGINKDLHFIDAEITDVMLGGNVIKVDKLAPSGKDESNWAMNGKIVLMKNNQSQMIVNINKEEQKIHTLNLLDVKKGDKIKIFAGCNKTIKDCRDKFKNKKNILAETSIPRDNPFTSIY